MSVKIGEQPTTQALCNRETKSRLQFNHMSQQTRAGELIFFWCTVLTMTGSLGALLFELVAFLGIGYEVPFLILLVSTLLSTIGLVVGTIGLISRRRWARAVLLLSSIYLPVFFSILAARGFTPPLIWWPLCFLGFIEAVLALLGPRLSFLEVSSE